MKPACSVCGALGHSSAECPHMPKSKATELVRIDFDEAGRRLLARMGVPVDGEGTPAAGASPSPAAEPCSRARSCKCPLCTQSLGLVADSILPERYKPLDAIWRSPEAGGGVVFVGSLQAASNAKLLQEHGIMHVVNCMNAPRQCRLEGSALDLRRSSPAARRSPVATRHLALGAWRSSPGERRSALIARSALHAARRSPLNARRSPLTV
mmetsp:Transcript_65580/g.212255  ORF Transcript_65580/g.212255 Transcript_65580/m.212255 type:complete len:210 (-) Transcript_65580:501-1130(-)